MTDDDSGAHVIDTSVLEGDAEHYWLAGAESLTALQETVPDVAATAFTLIPLAQRVHAAYAEKVAEFRTALADGASEYLAFKDTLIQDALDYERAEQASAAVIARLQAELAEGH